MNSMSPAYLAFPSKTCLFSYLRTYTPAGACGGDLPTYLPNCSPSAYMLVLVDPLPPPDNCRAVHKNIILHT
jgi:hypothetical protein